MLFKRRFNVKRFIRRARRFDPFEIVIYESLVESLTDNKKDIERVSLGLKLLLISDTHGCLKSKGDEFEEFVKSSGDFDLCILLGDLRPIDIYKILAVIPLHKIVALKGNHDFDTLYSDHGIKEVSGKVFKYKGVTFAGIDGTFRYKNERFPSHTQYESLKIAAELPPADVLISHDRIFSYANTEDLTHVGLVGCTYYVFANDCVQWHIHGHIHLSYQDDYSNGTREKSVYMWEVIEI